MHNVNNNENRIEVPNILLPYNAHNKKIFRYEDGKFKTDLDMCSPLMGARVTSGGAVCRHIASNLIDIYRYLGVPATYLAVTGTDGSVVNSIKDRILPIRTNHAVVLVGDNYGKYVL